MLSKSFFDRDAEIVAKDLLGKVIRHYYQHQWLSAMIIETEAYYLNEKGSHASLGFTEKRKALFMEPGTIYMYYSRGGDSINVSCQGEGNAVLIKSGIPYFDKKSPTHLAEMMLKLNPIKNTNKLRPLMKLCSGQTLLCKALGLRVTDWNQKDFHQEYLYIEDVGYNPEAITQTTRLGIPTGRDEHLLLRFIDRQYIEYCSKKPPIIPSPLAREG